VQGNFRLKTVLMIVATLVLASEAAPQSRAVEPLETRVPSAKEVLDAALVRAETERKNVLVHFGASWCSWCRHLDAMLESDEVGSLFQENYVITHLTIQESADKIALENPGAQEMLEAAGAGNAGVPAYLIFDSRGNQLATSLALPNGRNIGHPVTPEEIDAFLGLLENTAPRMTGADRARVAAYLSKQEY
jgi:thiol:disulfide interchange protein